MKKILFYIAICMLSCVVYSCMTIKGPRLVLSDYEINLGNVAEGVQCSKSVKIYNKGDESLHILGVTPDCPCTKTFIDNKTVDVGDSAILHITLDTTGKLGIIENYVVIQANTDTTIHYITVVGNVIKK